MLGAELENQTIRPVIKTTNSAIIMVITVRQQPRHSGNDRAVSMMRSIFTHLQTIAEWIVEIDRLHIWLMPRDAIAERTPVFLNVGQVRDERLK